jgi:tetratricopeptide (TPR) repeat protein
MISTIQFKIEKRKLLLLIALISFIGTFAQTPKKEVKMGQEFYKTKNYEDAIAQYSKAINLQVDYTDAYIYRAEAYLALKDYENAAADYKRATAFDQKNEKLYFLAGKLYAQLDNDEKAIELLSKSISIKRKYLPPYPYIIRAYLNTGKIDNALAISTDWVEIESDAKSHYYKAIVHDSLGQYVKSVDEFKKSIHEDEDYAASYLGIARVELNLNRINEAYKDINMAISLDKNNAEAYVVKSMIGVKEKDYPNAIDDISRAIIIDPESKELYRKRGAYYLEFGQYSNAIGDYNKILLLDKNDVLAYYNRGVANAQTGNTKNALADFQRFKDLSPGIPGIALLIENAEKQVYDLDKELNNPVVTFTEPLMNKAGVFEIPFGASEIRFFGIIEDQSKIKKIELNNSIADFDKNSYNPTFELVLNVKGVDEINLVVTDVYFNVLIKNIKIRRTEVNGPRIVLRAPVASDNGDVFLDEDNTQLYVEGIIEDESQIAFIKVNDMNASFSMEELNPSFTATISIANQSEFTVYAEDIYGNGSLQTFTLNRESIGLLADNPMGKTWVIFIENSNYDEFASLDGPEKDITIIRASLTNYKINNFLHKKDMTKKDMDRFFSIELRDLVRANQVKSLLIWYAGHGKFINETGYWIPINAKRDDEFTYFNINSIKAALQSYTNTLTHTLMINDACESGASFADLTRGEVDRRCDNWQDIKSKSSQVLSSAGYELALDNSQFTKTFANMLRNNPDACLPIEEIVKSVSTAVKKNNQQTPKFGTISGLGDENGTFFFIKK